MRVLFAQLILCKYDLCGF